MTNQAMTGAHQSSVQQPEVFIERSMVSSFIDAGVLNRVRRISDVPGYGSNVRDRDMALRRLFHLPGLEPATSAVSLRQQKVQTADWFWEGPETIAANFHFMTHHCNFGAGFEQFQSKFIEDFDTTDNGPVVEIIGDAPPLVINGEMQVSSVTGLPIPDMSQPLVGGVQSFANMDSTCCQRTGHPVYPIIYTDPNGLLHKLHATRVWYTSDMPSPDQRRLGVGFCALSRAVSVVQRLYKWGKMSSEMMDDFPASGMLVVRRMAKTLFEQQMKAYEDNRRMNEQEFYHALITLFFPDKDGGVELVPFSQVWENFDDSKFYDILIDLIAMSWNMDRQELAPLATASLGSGAQSGTLRKASRGKGIHTIMNLLERFMNLISPPVLTFKYDFTDEDQELQQAQIKQMKANTILSMYTTKQPDSNVSIDNVGQTTPAINSPQSEPLIDRDEARYLLVKEGVLPRELLGESQNLRPGWQKFDDVTMKAYRRFGPQIVINKAGEKQIPLRLPASRGVHIA
jgi:hypothetical protein